MKVAVDNATKRFGTLLAVSGVDLQIASGETVAIFGANGSGKSTLLKMIAGILRPTSGTVRVEGGPPLSSRASVGFLGHEPFLYPNLTAAENLSFFGKLYSTPPQIDLWLSRAGISNKKDALAGSLSRGETQKLAIARALLHDPDLLLLDEPFTGLDETSADAFPRLVARPGRTLCVVTHDIDRGKAMCDRVVTMTAGRLV